ncbi:MULTISPECIES: DUF5071 domain-containing protein [unclassified Paenibacillus]|uniref:DUF5071 domain-containing protein n=1 Tax=unclassified Paenibacillus TaxID=185978 RepID=UPI00384D86B2
MNPHDLIPKHKSDFDSINQLKLCSKAEIRPIIPELFTWLQDSNWPISAEVRNILFQFDMELIPVIRQILNSNDSSWKYFVLIHFCKQLPNALLGKLTYELNRLSTNPSENDKLEEVDQIAQEMLRTFYR